MDHLNLPCCIRAASSVIIHRTVHSVCLRTDTVSYGGLESEATEGRVCRRSRTSPDKKIVQYCTHTIMVASRCSWLFLLHLELMQNLNAVRTSIHTTAFFISVDLISHWQAVPILPICNTHVTNPSERHTWKAFHHCLRECTVTGFPG